MGIQGNIVVTEPAIAGFGLLGLIYVVYLLFAVFFSVGSYVLQSLAFYSIAKRRGIKHAWLSWIPVGSIWILGCISDQYRYVVKRQIKNKRKVMLGLGIAMLVIALAMAALGVGVLIEAICYGGGYQIIGNLLSGILGLGVGSLAISGLSIALVVIQYICLYDLYTSCDPSNNITYLLLSIFLGFLMPILLFVCRNKDLGMPPRKAQPVQEPAALEEPDESV